jgi:hypothetical protein
MTGKKNNLVCWHTCKYNELLSGNKNIIRLNYLDWNMFFKGIQEWQIKGDILDKYVINLNI